MTHTDKIINEVKKINKNTDTIKNLCQEVIELINKISEISKNRR